MLDTSITVPVIVDSVKRIERFDRSRCVYFRAEWDEDAEAVPLTGVRGGMLPMWDQAALLVKPLRSARFENVGLIERLFDRCMEHGMLVTQGHVWVPNRMLSDDEGDNARGNLYRLPYRLFLKCRQLSSDEDPEDGALSSWKGPHPEFSADETRAFLDWGQKQIRAAKRRYHSAEAASWRPVRAGESK